MFYEEFTVLLEDLAVATGNLIITKFNYLISISHFDDANNREAL